VEVNGTSLLATRDWSLSGASITFTTALASDDVHIEYQTAGAQLVNGTAHYETTLASGASLITLPITPTGTPLLTRGGVVQYQSAGHYSITGNIVTLSTAIGPTEDGLISVDFASGGTPYLQLTGGILTGPGNLEIDGNVGIGATQVAGYAVAIRPPVANLTGNSFQIGIFSSPTIDSTASNWGAALYTKINTAAASFTQGTVMSVAVGTPGLGAGSSITTDYGIYVYNQGATNVTNAYGIYIAAQSGASSTNIGLFNAATTTLNGAVTINGASQFTSQVSVGWQTPPANIALNVVYNFPNNTGGQQFGAKFVPAMDATATSGIGMYYQPTSNSSANLGFFYCIQLDTPNMGTATCTSIYGLRVENQGRASTTNAYGVYVQPQSGASTTNLGIYNGGTSQLVGNVGFNTPPVAGTAQIQLPNAGMIDVSQGLASGGQTLTNGQTWTPFGVANNFSGMILVDETIISGHPALFMTGGTATSLVSQTNATF